MYTIVTVVGHTMLYWPLLMVMFNVFMSHGSGYLTSPNVSSGSKVLPTQDNHVYHHPGWVGTLDQWWWFGCHGGRRRVISSPNHPCGFNDELMVISWWLDSGLMILMVINGGLMVIGGDLMVMIIARWTRSWMWSIEVLDDFGEFKRYDSSVDRALAGPTGRGFCRRAWNSEMVISDTPSWGVMLVNHW